MQTKEGTDFAFDAFANPKLLKLVLYSRI